MKKPQCVYVDAASVERLKDADVLSMTSVTSTLFRNGGESNGEPAVAFAEVTPELLEWLRSQKFDE